VTAVLAVSGLRKRYGRDGTEALRGVELELGPGELVGLLGPNGAGKSTLTKIACGLVAPTSGAVSVAGHPAGSLAARGAVGYLAELFRYPGWATATEVLRFHQRLARSAGGAPERERLLELVGLADASAKRVEEMSKGMQQRLGVAQALVGSPQVLLLDEPTSALDPVGRRIVRELMEHLRSEGVSVLLNSHLLGEVERVCERVAILIDGQIKVEGDTADLLRPRGIEVTTAAGPRLFEGAGREEAPRIVAELVGAGEQVFEVQVLASSLEDVYLEAVEGRTG
jgi:ABC-2 type transport system ATP-binding protein